MVSLREFVWCSHLDKVICRVGGPGTFKAHFRITLQLGGVRYVGELVRQESEPRTHWLVRGRGSVRERDKVRFTRSPTLDTPWL